MHMSSIITSLTRSLVVPDPFHSPWRYQDTYGEHHLGKGATPEGAVSEKAEAAHQE
jgi:hypothetical protein